MNPRHRRLVIPVALVFLLALVVVAAVSAGLRAIRAVRAAQEQEPHVFDDDSVITIEV